MKTHFTWEFPRADAHDRRTKTLLVEHKNRHSANTVVDRRFGEGDTSMSMEERMYEGHVQSVILRISIKFACTSSHFGFVVSALYLRYERFKKERLKRSRDGSAFALNDQEELTHRGQVQQSPTPQKSKYYSFKPAFETKKKCSKLHADYLFFWSG